MPTAAAAVSLETANESQVFVFDSQKSNIIKCIDKVKSGNQDDDIFETYMYSILTKAGSDPKNLDLKNKIFTTEKEKVSGGIITKLTGSAAYYESKVRKNKYAMKKDSSDTWTNFQVNPQFYNKKDGQT
jgi:hypothetical protein